MNPELAHNIKIVRKLHHLKQEDFAKKFTKISRTMQQSYETTKAEPSNLYVAELAAITGISAEILTTRIVKPDEIKIVEKTENTEDSLPSGNKKPDMFQIPTSSEPGTPSVKPTEKNQPVETDLQIAVRIHAQTIEKLTDLIVKIIGKS